MNIETEVKFLGVDFRELRFRLKREGAKLLKRYFEENVVFDTKERRLKEKNILLRLRRGEKNTLCLKKPPSGKTVAGLKILEEYEVEVNDFEITKKLFNNLGFCESFRYEKIREMWKLNECLICLDELPFGRFVEIEGDQGNIEVVVKKLSLMNYPSTDKNYYQLYLEIPEEDKSLVFPPSFKSRILKGGGVYGYFEES